MRKDKELHMGEVCLHGFRTPQSQLQDCSPDLPLMNNIWRLQKLQIRGKLMLAPNTDPPYGVQTPNNCKASDYKTDSCVVM